MLRHWQKVFFWALCTFSLPDGISAEVTMASLARQLQELQDGFEERAVDCQQQRVHAAQLAEHLQSLTSTMERYVTLLETGQRQDQGERAGSCASQFALIQAKLVSMEAKVDELGVADIVREVTSAPTSRPVRNPTTSTCPKNLTGIGSVQTVVSSRNTWGFWGRDVIRNNGHVYVMVGYSSPQIIHEYANEGDVQNNRIHKVHNLSEPCQGTGHVVRDGHLFCGNGTAVLKFNLEADLLVGSKLVSESVIDRTYQNGEGMDLSADDTWLWLVYAVESEHHNVQLEKLHPLTLQTLERFETHMPRRQIGQTFMICGVLYSLDSYSRTPSFIKHVFNARHETRDTLGTDDIQIETAFTKCWNNARWPAYIAMLNYDPWEQALYAWNCGHLEKYSVQLA